MTDITDDMLPELPEELGVVRCMIRGEMDYSEAGDYYYTRQQMRDYARTALAASRAEVDGVKKDAERYRWLRVNSVWETTISEEIEKVIDEELETGNV